MIRIHIDRLPSLNTAGRRRHWAVQHKEAERWKMLVWCAMMEAGYRLPKEPWQRVKMTLIRHSTRQPDYSNTVASFKGIEDALVKLKVIADDAPGNYVGGHPEYRWEYGPSGVTVEIEEA